MGFLAWRNTNLLSIVAPAIILYYGQPLIEKGFPEWNPDHAVSRAQSVLHIGLVAILAAAILIFGGSVLIETVFNISGIGRLMRDAVFSQDYQIVQSGVLIISTVVVLSNLLVDISYGWFDPRIRYR